MLLDSSLRSPRTYGSGRFSSGNKRWRTRDIPSKLLGQRTRHLRGRECGRGRHALGMERFFKNEQRCPDPVQLVSALSKAEGAKLRFGDYSRVRVVRMNHRLKIRIDA